MNYKVYLSRSAEGVIEIEADSEEEAQERALREVRNCPGTSQDYFFGDWEIYDTEETE